jgi:hypothetical protein
LRLIAHLWAAGQIKLALTAFFALCVAAADDDDVVVISCGNVSQIWAKMASATGNVNWFATSRPSKAAPAAWGGLQCVAGSFAELKMHTCKLAGYPWDSAVAATVYGVARISCQVAALIARRCIRFRRSRS